VLKCDRSDRSYAHFARRLAFPRIHASPAKPF
jgi:hypothetical protein